MEYDPNQSKYLLERVVAGEANKDLQDFYSLEPIAKVLPETRGLINTTFYIYPGDRKYTVTFFTSKNEAQVQQVAEVILSLKELPIAKPIPGRDGYVFTLYSLPAIVCPFLEGVPAVGKDHVSKVHIDDLTHRYVSKTFWDLHRQLRDFVGLGENLPVSIDRSPEDSLGLISRFIHQLNLPDNERKKIADFNIRCQEGIDKNLQVSERILVHSDFERQNILLSPEGMVSGIVDFDALRRGNLLYEFSHTLFNFVCCDPTPGVMAVDIYREDFIRMGILPEDTLRKVYSQISRFCIEDLLGFLEIACRRPFEIDKLIEHYTGALLFAYNNFKP